MLRVSLFVPQNLDWEFLEEDSGPDDKKWEGRPAS